MKNYKRYRLLEVGETTISGDQYLTIHGDWVNVTVGYVVRVGYVVHITSPTVIRREDDGKGTWVLLNNEETFENGDQLFYRGSWKVIGSMLPVGTNCENIRRKRVVETVKNKDDEMAKLEQTTALLKEANEKVCDLEDLLEKQRIVFNYQIDRLKNEEQNWKDLYIELVKETKNKK